MNNIKAYERAFQNAGDKEPIVNPEDETQAWAPLNNEGNSWVSVVFVEKTRKWYGHADAKKVRRDSIPAG